MKDRDREFVAFLDDIALQINHIFVYGVVACPVNEPIGPWRCIACGVPR